MPKPMVTLIKLRVSSPKKVRSERGCMGQGGNKKHLDNHSRNTNNTPCKACHSVCCDGSSCRSSCSTLKIPQFLVAFLPPDHSVLFSQPPQQRGPTELTPTA